MKQLPNNASCSRRRFIPIYPARFIPIYPAIEAGLLPLADVVELQEKEIRHIEEAFISLPEEHKNALKPVYEALDEAYEYNVLRCVRASLQYAERC